MKNLTSWQWKFYLFRVNFLPSLMHINGRNLGIAVGLIAIGNIIVPLKLLMGILLNVWMLAGAIKFLSNNPVGKKLMFHIKASLFWSQFRR